MARRLCSSEWGKEFEALGICKLRFTSVEWSREESHTVGDPTKSPCFNIFSTSLQK